MKIKIIYNVSLDYLVFDNREDSSGAQIGDRELLQKLEEIDKFTEQDKTTIKAGLDTYILKIASRSWQADRKAKSNSVDFQRLKNKTKTP